MKQPYGMFDPKPKKLYTSPEQSEELSIRNSTLMEDSVSKEFGGLIQKISTFQDFEVNIETPNLFKHTNSRNHNKDNFGLKLDSNNTKSSRTPKWMKEFESVNSLSRKKIDMSFKCSYKCPKCKNMIIKS